MLRVTLGFILKNIKIKIETAFSIHSVFSPQIYKFSQYL